MRKILAISSVLVFTACGGGGGGNQPILPDPSQSPNQSSTFTSFAGTDQILFFGDASGAVGDNVGIVAIPASAAKLVDIRWQQNAGPAIQSMAMHTPTLAFEVPADGSYEFTVSARLCSDQRNNSCAEQPISASVSFATTATPSGANIRLDHAAVEGGRVSLRVDPKGSNTISSVAWEVEGVVTPDNVERQTQRIFFDAPRVTRDTPLRIRANVSYSNGESGSDEAYIAVRNTEIDLDDGYFPRYAENIVSNNMFAYRANSDYASALEQCVYNNTVAASCQFSTLPLIGMDHNTPDIDVIMDRLLVSHAWMGERFEQYLRDSVVGPDMLQLLRGVTAIVISNEIRPSFYWAVTGAIYLDADNFWLTPEERDTLNEAPDYRSGFGAELAFIMPWRYVKNNDYYPSGSYPITDRSSRSFADLEADIAWLMYHELGHANDFFAPAVWSQLLPSQSPLGFINADRDADSDVLDQELPLRSSQMKAFAQVNFGGETATASQRATTAQEIADEFTNDGATGFYNYYTVREDYASLFEKFMMKYRLNADSDIAILQSRDIDPDLTVIWGERNRFNAPDIQPRVAFTVARIYPELDVQNIQTTLAPPIPMISGQSWFDNLVLSAAKGQTPVLIENREARWLKDTQQHHQTLPLNIPSLTQASTPD
jgi:hypothetical protein